MAMGWWWCGLELALSERARYPKRGGAMQETRLQRARALFVRFAGSNTSTSFPPQLHITLQDVFCGQ